MRNIRREQGAALGTLAAYSGVIIALTMLRKYFIIAYLWDPSEQPFSGHSFIPFYDLVNSSSWISPWFGYGGNLALFVPVGMLAAILFQRAKRPVLAATLLGGGFSFLIEAIQLVFSLGFSDIDDLTMNTLGAFLGAKVVHWCGPRLHKFWIGLSLASVAVFLFLVAIGDKIGDPSRIAPWE